MQRFILAVVALAALLIGIVVIAPGLVPVGAYKGRIEEAASTALGRQVKVGDNLHFKLVPQTAFHVTELMIANAEGFDAPHLAYVKAADIGVKLLPLLKGSVQIDRFVLTEPDINLARAKDGRVNWNLAGGPSSDPQQRSEPRDVQLGDVRIVDGKVAFVDGAAKKTYNFDDIDAAVTLKSLSEPLEIDGAFKFEGTPSKAKVVLTSLSKVMAKEPAGLKLDLTLGDASASADLIVESAEALAYAGLVSLNAPDLPAFAKMMGTPLADAPGFDKLAIKGQAKGGPNSLRLTGADIDFDQIDATGDIGLVWSGARPKATGRLAVGALDLRPYLPPPAAGAQGFPAWSEAKLDFASLRNIDADLDVTAEQVFLNDLKFGESRMKLKIENGRMVADIPELGMYGGAGSGQLVVNARQSAPAITGKFDVGSVQAEPFTKDLMKIDKLLGLGGFNMEFSASGSSQAAIMNSMDGKGGFDIADGSLKGINLGKLAAGIADLLNGDILKGGVSPAAVQKVLAIAQRPDETTDFSEFLSDFTIENGYVTAPSISLKGPLVIVTGKGAVNLPAQTLDLRLAPVAIVKVGDQEKRSVAIPLKITGTFSNPKPWVDEEALLKAVLTGGLGDFLRKPFAKPQPADGSDASTEEEEPNPVRDILDGVIGPKSSPPSDGSTTSGSSEAAETGESSAVKDGFDRIFGRTPAKSPGDAAPPAGAPASSAQEPQPPPTETQVPAPGEETPSAEAPPASEPEPTAAETPAPPLQETQGAPPPEPDAQPQ